MSWDENHFEYTCSDGKHPSFWKTVIESPQWLLWEKEQMRRFHLLDSELEEKDLGVYDMAEVDECGWISPGHFQQFLKFVIERSKDKIN